MPPTHERRHLLTLSRTEKQVSSITKTSSCYTPPPLKDLSLLMVHTVKINFVAKSAKQKVALPEWEGKGINAGCLKWPLNQGCFHLNILQKWKSFGLKWNGAVCFSVSIRKQGSSTIITPAASYSPKPSLISPGTVINGHVLCAPKSLPLQLTFALCHKYPEVFEIIFLPLLLSWGPWREQLGHINLCALSS